jgi:FkbM family methyltransferase
MAIYACGAGSKLIARMAVLIRRAATNQIQYRLVGSLDPAKNGEWWFISLIALRVETAFDVGANVGTWSEQVLHRCPNLCSLSCFEPSETATSRLAAAIGEDPRVRVVRVAVSDEEGLSPFYEPSEASPTSSLVSDINRGADEHIVPVVTIDQEMNRLSLEHLDLLKIDAEGYDLHALRGAQNALSRQAISFIQFEYNRAWMFVGSTLQAAARLLDAYDYQLFLLNRSGLCRCDVPRLGELFEYLNFVAIARPKIDCLAITVNSDPIWG